MSSLFERSALPVTTSDQQPVLRQKRGNHKISLLYSLKIAGYDSRPPYLEQNPTCSLQVTGPATLSNFIEFKQSSLSTLLKHFKAPISFNCKNQRNQSTDFGGCSTLFTKRHSLNAIHQKGHSLNGRCLAEPPAVKQRAFAKSFRDHCHAGPTILMVFKKSFSF